MNICKENNLRVPALEYESFLLTFKKLSMRSPDVSCSWESHLSNKNEWTRIPEKTDKSTYPLTTSIYEVKTLGNIHSLHRKDYKNNKR